MTKAELVEEVARAAELNKRDAEVIVETVFESIIGALHKGEKVELRGFGSFRTRERGPRRGRNPKTGEPVDVPAKRVPYFKPGKELKEYFTEEPGGDKGAGDAVEGESTAPATAEAGGSSTTAAETAGGGGTDSGETQGGAAASEQAGSTSSSSGNEGPGGGSTY